VLYATAENNNKTISAVYRGAQKGNSPVISIACQRR
jgi:hypothetical protein